MQNDGRIPLELDEIKDNKDNTLTFQFYYPSSYSKELMDDMKSYKDTLYSGIKTYALSNIESVLLFRTIELHNINMKLINDILKTDTEALLNSRSPDDFIKALCSFKIKVCRKKKFSIDDLFKND